MNRYRMNSMVEYIRMQDEFPFDVLDVEENLDEVLAYFGFFAQLTEDGAAEIRTALADIAGAAEWAEMTRLVGQEDDQLMEWADPKGECRDVFLLIHHRRKSVPPEEWLESLSVQ